MKSLKPFWAKYHKNQWKWDHKTVSFNMITFHDIWRFLWLLMILRDKIWRFIKIIRDISWLIITCHHPIGSIYLKMMTYIVYSSRDFVWKGNRLSEQISALTVDRQLPGCNRLLLCSPELDCIALCTSPTNSEQGKMSILVIPSAHWRVMCK